MTDKKIVKMLNKYEKQNIDLLATVEKEKGTVFGKIIRIPKKYKKKEGMGDENEKTV